MIQVLAAILVAGLGIYIAHRILHAGHGETA